MDSNSIQKRSPINFFELGYLLPSIICPFCGINKLTAFPVYFTDVLTENIQVFFRCLSISCGIYKANFFKDRILKRMRLLRKLSEIRLEELSVPILVRLLIMMPHNDIDILKQKYPKINKILIENKEQICKPIYREIYEKMACVPRTHFNKLSFEMIEYFIKFLVPKTLNADTSSSDLSDLIEFGLTSVRHASIVNNYLSKTRSSVHISVPPMCYNSRLSANLQDFLLDFSKEHDFSYLIEFVGDYPPAILTVEDIIYIAMSINTMDKRLAFSITEINENLFELCMSGRKKFFLLNYASYMFFLNLEMTTWLSFGKCLRHIIDDTPTLLGSAQALWAREFHTHMIIYTLVFIELFTFKDLSLLFPSPYDPKSGRDIDLTEISTWMGSLMRIFNPFSAKLFLKKIITREMLFRAQDNGVLKHLNLDEATCTRIEMNPRQTIELTLLPSPMPLRRDSNGCIIF